MDVDTTTTPAVATPVAPTKAPAPFATLDQYKQAIADAGLSYIEQSGFLRVEAATGRRLYVATTKTVRRVDLSGWEFALGRLTKPPHTTITGNVKQQMVIGQGPDADLEAFAELLAHMKTLDAVAKVEKAPKAKKQKDAAPASSPDAEPVEDKAAKRLAQIAKVKQFAALRNQAVSQKVLDEEAALLAAMAPAATQPEAQAAE